MDLGSSRLCPSQLKAPSSTHREKCWTLVANMPQKSNRAKGFDGESLVAVLSLLVSLAQGGGLPKLLALLGDFGSKQQPKSSKNKRSQKAKKLGATRAKATAKRTTTPTKDAPEEKGRSWAEVLQTDTKEEWILDKTQWSVPVIEASALASGSTGVCLTSQSHAKDIVAAGKKQVAAALVTHKKTPLSEPAMLHLVKKGKEEEAVLRKMHITQVGVGKTYPKNFKAESKGRNKLIIMECHHDLASATYLKQLTDAPNEAWQLWMKSKGLVDGDLPELTSTRTSSFKGRTITSTAGFIPNDKIGGLLKFSGNDGVFVRIPRDVENDTHKVIWLEGTLEQAWRSVSGVTDHHGMIRPASGKYGLRVETSKLETIQAQLPEGLRTSMNKKPVTVAGLDPTLTRNQVKEEIKTLFKVDVDLNYSYMRYGVKHWTTQTTDMGIVVMTEGLTTHKSTLNAPPGLGKKRSLRVTPSAEEEENARAYARTG
eukprot:6490865-Amphidinium_carterae.1